ncbi:hypothetical protein SEVIR_7G106501v4 [Setaria viridis]
MTHGYKLSQSSHGFHDCFYPNPACSIANPCLFSADRSIIRMVNFEPYCGIKVYFQHIPRTKSELSFPLRFPFRSSPLLAFLDAIYGHFSALFHQQSGGTPSGTYLSPPAAGSQSTLVPLPVRLRVSAPRHESTGEREMPGGGRWEAKRAFFWVCAERTLLSFLLVAVACRNLRGSRRRVAGISCGRSRRAEPADRRPTCGRGTLNFPPSRVRARGYFGPAREEKQHFSDEKGSKDSLNATGWNL